MLKVNTNKAMSYDNIPPRAIKESAKILCYPFSILFNHILKNSRIPQQWRLGEVSLVNKKDCCLTKSNYRPLSILPSLSKIFKMHIHSRISHYFEDIFHEHVFTYRKNHRTDTALLSLRTVEEETWSTQYYWNCVNRPFSGISHLATWTDNDKIYILELTTKPLTWFMTTPLIDVSGSD